jgi:hypothetical protein
MASCRPFSLDKETWQQNQTLEIIAYFLCKAMKAPPTLVAGGRLPAFSTEFSTSSVDTGEKCRTMRAFEASDVPRHLARKG